MSCHFSTAMLAAEKRNSAWILSLTSFSTSHSFSGKNTREYKNTPLDLGNYMGVCFVWLHFTASTAAYEIIDIKLVLY